MWKSTVEPDRPQMTIWRKRIACWILKATNTHSEYVVTFSPTATMFARTRLSVTSVRELPVLLTIHVDPLFMPVSP